MEIDALSSALTAVTSSTPGDVYKRQVEYRKEAKLGDEIFSYISVSYTHLSHTR